MAMLATRNLPSKLSNYLKILAAVNISSLVPQNIPLSCCKALARHNLLENVPNYQITVARNYAKGRDKKKDKGLLILLKFHMNSVYQ